VWLAQSAIPKVHAFARVPKHALETAKARLSEADGTFSSHNLSEAHARMQREQPNLAAWLSSLLTRRIDDAARAFGASLATTIWLSFTLHFGSRLGRVGHDACDEVDTLLRTDEELRKDDLHEVIESDDIIAAHQPDIARVVRSHMDETMASFADDIDVDDVDRVYRMILVEVLALSYAVTPPANELDKADPGRS
jgi:hypothetical protein